MTHTYRSLLTFLLVTMLTGLLASCVETIEYRGTQDEPLLVVNALAEVGQPLEVSVTYAVFFLADRDAGARPVSDARVTATINGDARLLSYDAIRRRFIDDRPLAAGDKVTIDASAPEAESVTTTTVIPHPAEVQVVSSSSLSPYNPADESFSVYNAEYGYMTRTDSIWDLSFRIVPAAADEHCCYRLTVIPIVEYIVREDDSEDPDTLLDYCPINIPRSTRLLLDDGIGSGQFEFIEQMLGDDADLSNHWFTNSQSMVFSSDRLHAAEDFLLTFRLGMYTSYFRGGSEYWYDSTLRYGEPWYDYETDSWIQPEDGDNPWDYTDPTMRYSLQIYVETLTEDYYRYLSSSDAFDDSEWNLLGEQVQIYSNVKGGTGIFAAHATSISVPTRSYTFPLIATQPVLP